MSRVQRRFEVHRPPEDVAQRLRDLGWDVEDGGADRIEARQGSQLTMRVLGGWFVSPSKLPKQLTAERTEGGMTISVEESMGFGILDSKLRRKYEKAFAELQRQLGG